MNEYKGHWIETYTGKKFHYLNPQPDEIDIIDIAHALSLTCRFGGHCKTFYSVAQHSILVASQVPEELTIPALLHDAAEAYLPDVPRPVKQSLNGFKEMERTVIYAIMDKYANGFRDYQLIKFADNILLATEARDLMNNTDGWAKLPEPLDEVIVPWTPQQAEDIFLGIYYSLEDI